MAKLFIVGTPIGNLKDITLRALEVLKMADYIACEDKRKSSILLDHYNITQNKLISYHNFNEKNSAKGIVDLLRDDKNVALISDAGMPVISDPGFLVIKEVKEANLGIEIIPGVSAITTSFALCSLSNIFSFQGFINPKKNSLMNELMNLTPGTYIYFVSPHKLLTTLEIIHNVFQGKEKIFLAKELTKLNEQFFEGTAQEIIELLGENIKGEYTLILKKEEENKKKINKYKVN
ncbi:MAG: 16S rRNA (cytidine(1402)-2'-O)-methyltransferase [Metamycoplasmataceae bacterium]